MPKIIQRPQAEADALEQTAYIAADNPDAAARFVADLQAAFADLTAHPYLGRPWPTRSRALQDVRRLILSDFPVSIFYRPALEVIEIIRVLHHRRSFPPELAP